MDLGVLYPNFGNIMSLVFHYFWIFPICMGSIITVVQTGEEKMFTWNRNNTMFKAGGASLSIPLGSNLKIKCPDNKTMPLEYYKIYWVPKSSFMNCFINEEDRVNVSLLVNCNNASKDIDFVTVIKSFTGTPGSIDFKLGHNYYIATFSTGTYSGLGNEYTDQGACSNFNMKLNLTVVKEEIPTTQAPSQGTKTSTKKTSWPDTTTVSSTTSSTTSTRQYVSTSTHSSTSVTQPHTSPVIPDPDPTDIVIEVPDGGNTGVIEANSARTISPAWVYVVLSLGLSLVYISNLQHTDYYAALR